MSSQPSAVKGKGKRARKSAKPSNVFDGVLSPKELLELLGAVGTSELQLLCDGRSQVEQDRLTDDQKRQLRQEAAEEIRQIPVLRAQHTPFKGEMVPLADVYYWVLVGHEQVRNLQHAIKTLVAMLKDARVPQKHKGERGTKGVPVAIRLAIESALEAQADEFQRNLERLPELIDEFYQARDKGNVVGMERIVNLLARPYFRGPLVEHHDCGSASNLRFWFDGLQMEIDAVKAARE